MVVFSIICFCPNIAGRYWTIGINTLIKYKIFLFIKIKLNEFPVSIDYNAYLEKGLNVDIYFMLIVCLGFFFFFLLARVLFLK